PRCAASGPRGGAAEGGGGTEQRRPTTSVVGEEMITKKGVFGISHDRMAAKEADRRMPVKATSRRSRARVARALTGLRRSGRGLAPSDHGSDPFDQSARTRGVRSAAKSPDFGRLLDRSGAAHLAQCGCRLFKTTCRQVLATKTDRPQLAAFILPWLAIARSAGGTPPFPRGASPNCDLTKSRRSTTAEVAAQSGCSVRAGPLAAARHVMLARSTEGRT